MARRNLALGDLRDMMEKYKNTLAAAKATHRLDRDGNPSSVDAEQVRRAAAALEAAISEVEQVCQEAVLAIVVEES
jgi:hypothetical protein